MLFIFGWPFSLRTALARDKLCPCSSFLFLSAWKMHRSMLLLPAAAVATFCFFSSPVVFLGVCLSVPVCPLPPSLSISKCLARRKHNKVLSIKTDSRHYSSDLRQLWKMERKREEHDEKKKVLFFSCCCCCCCCCCCSFTSHCMH